MPVYKTHLPEQISYVLPLDIQFYRTIHKSEQLLLKQIKQQKIIHPSHYQKICFIFVQIISCKWLPGAASLVSHHPLGPEQLISGSLIIRNSIFAQNPRNFVCDRIFLAHTFTSIPKMKFLRFQCPATLRHDVAKCQTQAVMAYPSHSSTVFCVLQDKI